MAALADVSAMTVTRFENGRSSGYPETLKKVRSALEAAGVIFVDENGDGPGVRVKKDRHKLERGIEASKDALETMEKKPSPQRALHEMKIAIVKDIQRGRRKGSPSS